MRRNCDLFNIQATFLLAIVFVTIYISTIKIQVNDVHKSELINFSRKYVKEEEKVIHKFEEVRLIDKIKELPASQRALIPVYRILNGKQNYVFKTDS